MIATLEIKTSLKLPSITHTLEARVELDSVLLACYFSAVHRGLKSAAMSVEYFVVDEHDELFGTQSCYALRRLVS